jgi:hypothetical protein
MRVLGGNMLKERSSTLASPVCLIDGLSVEGVQKSSREQGAELIGTKEVLITMRLNLQ